MGCLLVAEGGEFLASEGVYFCHKSFELSLGGSFVGFIIRLALDNSFENKAEFVNHKLELIRVEGCGDFNEGLERLVFWDSLKGELDFGLSLLEEGLATVEEVFKGGDNLFECGNGVLVSSLSVFEGLDIVVTSLAEILFSAVQLVNSVVQIGDFCGEVNQILLQLGDSVGGVQQFLGQLLQLGVVCVYLSVHGGNVGVVLNL